MVMEERLGFWAPGSWGGGRVRDRGFRILGPGVKGLGAPTPGSCGRKGLAAPTPCSRQGEMESWGRGCLKISHERVWVRSGARPQGSTLALTLPEPREFPSPHPPGSPG